MALILERDFNQRPVPPSGCVLYWFARFYSTSILYRPYSAENMFVLEAS